MHLIAKVAEALQKFHYENDIEEELGLTAKGDQLDSNLAFNPAPILLDSLRVLLGDVHYILGLEKRVKDKMCKGKELHEDAPICHGASLKSKFVRKVLVGVKFWYVSRVLPIVQVQYPQSVQLKGDHKEKRNHKVNIQCRKVGKISSENWLHCAMLLDGVEVSQ